MEAANKIVFQFPMLLFMVPTSCKYFIETCFTEGFAYDFNIEEVFLKLKGKTFQAICTTGSSLAECKTDGYDYEACMRPLLYLAKSTGMIYTPTFFLYDGMTIDDIRDEYLAALK